MINNSGIGTYLRNVLPYLSKKFDVVLLGDPNALIKLGTYKIIPFDAPIFSIKEQVLLPFIIPTCSLFWTPHYNVPFLPIRAKNRVVTLHDAYYHSFYDTLSFSQKVYVSIAGWISKKFSFKIITVSSFSKNELVKYLHCESDIIEVVYNGVAENFDKEFEYKHIKDDYILFVGNVKPHKNLKNALLAFSIFLETHPNYKFYIVGRKEGFITGEDGITDLIEGFKDSIIFTGYVSIEDLKNYYKNANVFFFPSKYEGFGIPILEAMKFKIPIVSSNVASLPEVGGNSVLYCDPYSVENMAKTLCMAVNEEWVPNYELYEEQLKKFTWEQVADKHIQIFNEIL